MMRSTWHQCLELTAAAHSLPHLYALGVAAATLAKDNPLHAFLQCRHCRLLLQLAIGSLLLDYVSPFRLRRSNDLIEHFICALSIWSDQHLGGVQLQDLL